MSLLFSASHRAADRLHGGKRTVFAILISGKIFLHFNTVPRTNQAFFRFSQILSSFCAARRTSPPAQKNSEKLKKDAPKALTSKKKCAILLFTKKQDVSVLTTASSAYG